MSTLMSLEEEVLTTNDVVKMLKISKPTLYNLIDDGKIKVIKISGKFLFTKTEIQRFLDEEPKFYKKDKND